MGRRVWPPSSGLADGPAANQSQKCLVLRVSEEPLKGLCGHSAAFAQLTVVIGGVLDTGREENLGSWTVSRPKPMH